MDDNKETSTVEGLEQVREKEKGAMGGGGVSVELGGGGGAWRREGEGTQSSLKALFHSSYPPLQLVTWRKLRVPLTE